MATLRGGKRNGAGRPAGSGKYGIPTKAIRIPVDYLKSVDDLIKNKGFNKTKYPLYLTKVFAGFPSPADDHIDKMLSLDDHLIKHPEATFFLKVTGDSMIDAGILPGDLMIVDRSLTPNHGKIVIAVINGELTVKRLHMKDGQIKLMPENKKYQPIILEEGSELDIWGVVSSVIHLV